MKRLFPIVVRSPYSLNPFELVLSVRSGYCHCIFIRRFHHIIMPRLGVPHSSIRNRLSSRMGKRRTSKGKHGVGYPSYLSEHIEPAHREHFVRNVRELERASPFEFSSSFRRLIQFHGAGASRLVKEFLVQEKNPKEVAAVLNSMGDYVSNMPGKFPEERVRAQTHQRLVRETLTPTFLRLLRSPDNGVRNGAARVLNLVGVEPKAFPALRRLSKDLRKVLPDIATREGVDHHNFHMRVRELRRDASRSNRVARKRSPAKVGKS